MSKKKNTLKDLDEFLKQQAASLVTPKKLNIKSELAEETIPEPQSEEPPVEPVDEPAADHQKDTEIPQAAAPTFKEVFRNLQELSRINEPTEFRKKLFELILATVEAQHHQLPEDKILINTMLYLKHGEHWKEGIKEYWQNHE